jgi:aldehyde dehydrogenase (NAD+)
MERQRSHFATGETREVGGRVAALRRLEVGLMERREDLCAALESDLGKPEIEVFLAEYHFLLGEIRQVCRHLKRWLRPRKVGAPFYFQPSRNRILREPFGVALVIAPWNYPVQLALAPLIAAVAAGNTVVLKPSEMSPASAAFLNDLVGACFNPKHVAVVNGGVEVAEELLEQRFDFVFFTGSTEVGRVVARKAAGHLTPCVLELGGKCPCVVDRNVDVSIAARRILIGKLFNAGQTCFAPDFVAVHRDMRKKLVEALASLLEELPWEEEMARVVNKRHYQRLLGLVAGREIRKGEDDAERLHFAPRILPEAGWEDAAMREEIFGPILPVVEFADREELTDRLLERSSPLALYVFSRNDEFVDALMDRVPSGSVCINDVAKQSTNLDLPFGGVGASGYGRYRGRAGVESFTYERSVTKRYFLRDFFETLPPRGEKLEFLKKWMK